MPSDRDATRRWLTDILYNIALAEAFTAGVAYDAFKDDIMRLYAVIRCLELISEASRRLPDDLKARHSSIAWKRMAGAESVYRHDYEDVAAFFVRVALQDHLPILRSVIEQEFWRPDMIYGYARVSTGAQRSERSTRAARSGRVHRGQPIRDTPRSYKVHNGTISRLPA